MVSTRKAKIIYLLLHPWILHLPRLFLLLVVVTLRVYLVIIRINVFIDWVRLRTLRSLLFHLILLLFLMLLWEYDAFASHSTTQSSHKSTSVPSTPLISRSSTSSTALWSRVSIETIQVESDTDSSAGEDNVVLSKFFHCMHRM